MTRAATLRLLCRTASACALVCLVSCTTFDKAGEKPLVRCDSPADPVAMRQAVIEVFGGEGFVVVSQVGDPMVFSRPARMAERLAYQDLSGSELFARTSVSIIPSATGSRVLLWTLVLNRPGTLFEDTHYPVVGTRSYYRKLLGRASRQAQWLAE